MLRLYRYRTHVGKEPFGQWLDSIKDLRTRARIQFALRRWANEGNADTQWLGDGLLELRLHFGAGYRIYFTRTYPDAILLMGGGSKKTQLRDIHKAKGHLSEWKRKSK